MKREGFDPISKIYFPHLSTIKNFFFAVQREGPIYSDSLDCGEVGEVYFGDRIKSPAGFLLIYEVKFWYVYYRILVEIRQEI
jgi:hypothetical protein